MSKTMGDLGRLAYEAYSVSTGGVSAVSGDRLPLWDAQNHRIQAAWTRAAAAVLDGIRDETCRPGALCKSCEQQSKTHPGHDPRVTIGACRPSDPCPSCISRLGHGGV